MKGFLKLNNYNNWSYYASKPEDEAIKFDILSKKDSLALTEGWDRVISTEEIRRRNSSVSVYRIYDLCVKNSWDSDYSGGSSYMQTPLTKEEIDKNDWWLRDGNGCIVEEKGTTRYLDVGKPGFKEAFTKAVLERNAGKGFDGFVFDYWYPSINNDYFAIPGGWFRSHPLPEAYPSDIAWFTMAWEPFITYLSSTLRKAGYKIIGNCVGEYGNLNSNVAFQRSAVDAAIYEQWVVDWEGYWLPGSTIDRRIKAFALDPLEVWCADFGLNANVAAYEDKARMGLAMYYIASPADKERSYHHYHDSKIYWLLMWDFDIGVPVEDYIKHDTRYFWSRKYSEGLVIMNYEPTEVTYNLHGSYVDDKGVSYKGEINIPLYTALILKSVQKKAILSDLLQKIKGCCKKLLGKLFNHTA